MKTIEDELKHPKFSHETVRANINILYTANWLYNKGNQNLKPFRLTMEQFNVLKILSYDHPKSLRQKDILERMISPSSNLTLIVKKLIKKELIDLNKSDIDKRQYDINLSDKGMDLVKKINQAISENQSDHSSLSESEAFHLNALLDKIRM